MSEKDLIFHSLYLIIISMAVIAVLKRCLKLFVSVKRIDCCTASKQEYEASMCRQPAKQICKTTNPTEKDVLIGNVVFVYCTLA